MDPGPQRTNRCQLPLGKSPAIRELLSRAKRFARPREPIPLLGEPGTGKTPLGR
jgi:transcriptional regulator with PAS, ATPase and Fis domain